MTICFHYFQYLHLQLAKTASSNELIDRVTAVGRVTSVSKPLFEPSHFKHLKSWTGYILSSVVYDNFQQLHLTLPTNWTSY